MKKFTQSDKITSHVLRNYRFMKHLITSIPASHKQKKYDEDERKGAFEAGVK